MCFISSKGRCMSLVQAASDVPEQGAVDDRDTFLHGVRDLLSIYSNAQAGLPTYVSVPGIVQQLSNLQSELRTLQSDLEYALPEDRNRCINELCTLIQSYTAARNVVELLLQSLFPMNVEKDINASNGKREILTQIWTPPNALLSLCNPQNGCNQIKSS
ncbi:hypothetical protein ACS0TY_029230 [Phlomoides rotata]